MLRRVRQQIPYGHRQDHVLLSPATSVQIFPAPWPGWAAVSLPAKPEPILAALMLAEELEQACPRQPVGQRGGLLLRARPPQPGQQPGHGARVVEGDVGGGSRASSAAACSCAPASRSLASSRPRRAGRRGRRGRRIAASQRGGLLLARPPPAAWPAGGHGVRVVEGGVGGGAFGQRGGLLLRARLPQPAQQPGHAVRVVEGDVGGGIRASSAAACSCAPASRSLSSSLATAPGSSRGTWAAAQRTGRTSARRQSGGG